MSLIPELENLPDVSYIGNRTAATIANELVGDYLAYLQEHTGMAQTLAQADPVRLILLSAADMFHLLFQAVDLAGKSDLLKYAEGAALDHLGAVKKVTRLPASPAQATVRFSLTSSRTSATGVPAGTRVADAAGNYFMVSTYFEIPPGDLYGDTIATAIIPGAEANGLPEGSINVLVDQVAYIASVTNTTVSAGGAGVESDDDFTRRIYNAPLAYSVAGPRGAYEYWARQSRADIEDVLAWSPSAANVSVVFLLEGGAAPSEEDIAQMEAYLSADTIRPIADRVTVSAPQETTYSIDMTYYIAQEDSARAATIQQAVAEAVAGYVQWQRKIGRDIIPSELIRRVMDAGARRVQLTAPVYTLVDAVGIARLSTQNVTYGGLEED